MYRISKKFEFSADHALKGLPPEHQCSRFHGHNYVVDVVLESAVLNETDFVRDYGELSPIKDWINKTLDHRWLGWGMIARLEGTEPCTEPCTECENGPWHVSQITKPVLDFNPTAENMAKFIYTFACTIAPEVSMVGVSETPKTWAWYTPNNLTLDVLEHAVATLPQPLRTSFRAALRDNT